MKYYIMKLFPFALGLILVGVAACDEKVDPLYDLASMKVGYFDDIKPILDARCTYCHSADVTGEARNGAPVNVNLDTYGSSRSVGPRANTQIQADRMPPSEPLSEAAKQTFQQWINDGMLE